MSIELLQEKIPAGLLEKSGSVFYSGRSAFLGPKKLYLIGLNPGGDPEEQQSSTIRRHTAHLLANAPDNWSAYRDESWRNAEPGTKGLAPRVLHLLQQLSLDPGLVPASNLIFQRTRRESHLAEKFDLATTCWPFHETAISFLQPKLILCFGKTVGNFVARSVEANTCLGYWQETNARRWRTTARTNGKIIVVSATHPSIADWAAKDTDPSNFIKALLRDT